MSTLSPGDTTIDISDEVIGDFDAFVGTYRADTLIGGFGDDSIEGLGGNDSLDGQAGSDVIRGGDGNDVIEGNFGNDTLYGDAGDDTLTDDQGSNILDGGSGNDYLTSRSLSGDHTLLGGSGNDNLNATGLLLNLDGGEGADNLQIEGRLNVGGSDQFVQGGVATLSGGTGDDYVNARDYSTAELHGGADNDRLATDYVTNAQLYGEAGDDNLDAYIYGYYTEYTDGNQSLPQSAYLDGGDGNDNLTVRGSNNLYYGRTTATGIGGFGDDVISITDDSSDSNSGYTSVSVDAGDGSDTITVAGSFSTSITTGTGSDTVVITAAQYRKLLVGAQLVNNPDGTSSAINPDPFLIRDFNTGSGGDILDYGDLLRNATTSYDGSNPFSTGFLVLEQSGNDTLLSFDPDGSAGTSVASTVVAVFQNTTATAFTADNFNPNFPTDGSPASPQTLNGTYRADTLIGGFGDDSIEGLGGNDSLDGQAGSDVIRGGDGNDVIEGNFGNDTLYGDAGDDTLTDDQGSNILDGGSGNDYLTSRSLSGDHTLLGGSGNDNLNATGLLLNLDGGEGADNLQIEGRLNVGGSDQFVQGGVATLSGGTGDDYVNARDYSTAELHGGADNDRLATDYVTNAQLYGEAGDDNLDAYIYGYYTEYTDGNQSLPQSAYLDGGDGNDNLTVRGSNNLYYGRTTATGIGGFGDDVISITDDSSDSNSGYTSVSVDAGDGSDTITVAGSFSTSITTGTGSDTVVITAAQYRKLLVGAQLVNNPDGTSSAINPDPFLIRDFNTGSGGDILDYGDLLRNATTSYDGSNPFSTGFLVLEQSGNDTLLSFDPDGSAGTSVASTVVAVFQNTTATAFTADNFNPNFPVNGDDDTGGGGGGTPESPDELLLAAQGLAIIQILPNGNDFDCIFVLENGYVVNVDGGTDRYPAVVGDAFVHHGSGDVRLFTTGDNHEVFIAEGKILASHDTDVHTEDMSRTLVIEYSDGVLDAITFEYSSSDSAGTSNSWNENSELDLLPVIVPNPTPTYLITPSASSINEGESFTSTITTTHVVEGTTLYWSLSGTGINANDLSAGTLTGSGSVAADGSFNFTHTLAADLTTEGNETISIQLFSDSNRTQILGTAASVLINDTSITPDDDDDDPPTDSIFINDLSIQPGTTVAIPINISDATGVQSLDLNFSYDPSIFNAPASGLLITPGSLNPAASFVVNNNPPGEVSISWAGFFPLSEGSGSIATLNLEATADATAGSSLIDLVSASINEGAISSELVDGTVTILPSSFQVTEIQELPNGLALRLTDAPDLDVFNLYDGIDGSIDAADLQLTAPSGDAVVLSAHWQEGSKELFLLADDPLIDGNYILNIDSRTDGLISGSSAALLDGNNDGMAGDALSTTINYSSTDHFLSIADTARGAGQSLNLNGRNTHDSITGLPKAEHSGLPIQLSTTASLTSFSGQLSYDSSILILDQLQSSLSAGADLPSDWSLQIDPSSPPGELRFFALGTTAISGTDMEILRFQASISPDAAPPARGNSGNGLYGSTTLINATFSSDQLISAPIAIDPGLIVLAYAGDTTGNGTLSSLDASSVQRVVVGLDSGFDAYDSVNPIHIGDTTGNGSLSSLDASRIQQQVVGLPVDSFPDVPDLESS